MSYSRWVDTWFEIGAKNPQVQAAYDPPFKRDGLLPVISAEQLAEKMGDASPWCLGTAFYWDDQCWINVVEGGNEWMVIKQDVVFESMNGRRLGPEAALRVIKAIANTDIKKGRKMDYVQSTEVKRG